jgi:hypothetical protein
VESVIARLFGDSHDLTMTKRHLASREGAFRRFSDCADLVTNSSETFPTASVAVPAPVFPGSLPVTRLLVQARFKSL